MRRGRVDAAAVILSAGCSTRLGGSPKALARVEGRTLLQLAVQGFRLCGLNRLTVVAGHGRAEVEAAAKALAAPVVFNEQYEQGMFTSVRAGVTAIGRAEAFFVLPVDAALVHPQTVLSLLTAWRSPGRRRGGVSVLVPAFQGHTGHPPLIDGDLAPALCRWAGPGGLRGWLASLAGPAAAEFEAGRMPAGPSGALGFLELPDEGLASDLDTPGDLAGAALLPGRPRPSLDEAWQLLRQAGLKKGKMDHSRLVAAGALRLALALNRAGRATDPDLAATAGLLHDLARREPRHASAGRRWAGALGWAEPALIIGAHTDLPGPVFQAALGFNPAEAQGDDGPEDPGYASISPALARAALSVYLADKYWLEDHPVSLAERFDASRAAFAEKPPARAAADRRLAMALAVENRLAGLIGEAPESAARRPAGHDLEKTLAALTS